MILPLRVNKKTIKRITKELEFYHSFETTDRFSKHILGDKNWHESLRLYIETHTVGIIDYGNECLSDDDYQYVIDIIDSTNHKILIKSSNLYDSKFGFHPLTNIALWEAHSMPVPNIFDGSEDNEFFNPFSPWITKDLQPTNKVDRYILSVRRGTPIRDRLFKKIDDAPRKWDCTVRYSKYHEANQDATSYIDTPTLLDEIRVCLVDFVVETIYSGIQNYDLNYSINLTEKTLFAIDNKSIPLFYGCKNLTKALDEVGFYTFDSYFKLNIDDMDPFENKKMEHYVKCLMDVDAMSYTKIYNTYIKLFPKIEHNYNLLNYLFELNQLIRSKYMVLRRFVN